MRKEGKKNTDYDAQSCGIILDIQDGKEKEMYALRQIKTFKLNHGVSELKYLNLYCIYIMIGSVFLLTIAAIICKYWTCMVFSPALPISI